MRVSVLEEAIAKLRSVGDRLILGHTLAWLADLAFSEPRLEVARRHARESVELQAMAGILPEFGLEVLVHVEAAGGRFERAIQLAGFLSAQRPYGRVTVRSVGSQLAEHAQQRLGSDRAAAVWAQGEAMTIADAAAFSLDENVARPAIIPSKPDRRCLTQREMQVLGLVARGKSNKEIAAAPVVSTRTVERHIENVYAKIGTSGRAGAAAYAVRQSLD